ncbi:hypothetical protein [Thermoplasma volcanium GSS1]|uniref:PUA domain-containing protein n=1 Tax=Thermoplasma volcanium (strain ATCC 51530 / DSM 4299 / JCM 9571 / NBRC 15438 / GSS1) TaxID=273116 RepID=Q978F1_THEVO|nr:DUF1947 domain-containing protein [Thermoplasma volcanium]BAB60608.1 hypothetical protein [Thermoplasma volcanium GSS1]
MTQKHFLSKRELKVLVSSAAEIGIDLSGEEVEVSSSHKVSCYYIKGKPMAFQTDRLIPSVYLLNYKNPEKRAVVVDAGAEPHIINGSNVFAQGILSIDSSIKKGDIVFIKSEKGYFIGVGIAERNAEEIMNEKKGLAVRLIHHPDDDLMKAFS